MDDFSYAGAAGISLLTYINNWTGFVDISSSSLPAITQQKRHVNARSISIIRISTYLLKEDASNSSQVRILLMSTTFLFMFGPFGLTNDLSLLLRRRLCVQYLLWLHMFYDVYLTFTFNWSYNRIRKSLSHCNMIIPWLALLLLTGCKTILYPLHVLASFVCN